MKKFKSLLIIFLIVIIFSSGMFAGENETPDPDNNTLYFFWIKGCSHCYMAREFLEELGGDYPYLKVVEKEILENKEDRKLYLKILKKEEVEYEIVPVIVYRDQVWLGISDEIKSEIRVNITQESSSVEQKRQIELFNHTYKLDSLSPVPATVLIAFVDGFNPCSLWVLIYLLSFLLYSGSRGRAIILGFIFLLTTAAVYGMFMTGIFKAITILSHFIYIRMMIGVFTLSVGLLNIKEYFWFKRGFSLNISDKHKKGIAARFRKFISSDSSFILSIFLVIITAGGISLIELPCTAGFPVLWSNILSINNIDTSSFIYLLLIYLFIYLADEVLIYGIAIYKMDIRNLSRKQGRRLKLISGIIMIYLAIVFLFFPDLMNSFRGVLALVILSVATYFLIVVTDLTLEMIS